MHTLVDSLLPGLVGALAGSGATIWYQARQSRKAVALRLLESIEEKLGHARVGSTKDLQQEVLSFYTSVGGSLSSGAKVYLDYLGALDFFLFCASRGLVDASDARYWLRDLLKPDQDSVSFIQSLREATGNGAALEFLFSEFKKAAKPRRRNVFSPDPKQPTPEPPKPQQPAPTPGPIKKEEEKREGPVPMKKGQ